MPAAQAEMVSTKEALGEMSLGSKDAPVTIYAFESLTCPHCAAFHQEAFKKIESEYIKSGKVRIVFRDFPLDQRAFLATMVARCLGPAKYVTMVSTLFENQRNWAYVPGKSFINTLGGYARLAGLTGEEFQKCIRDKELAQGIYKMRQDSAKTYNIESTPTFVVGKTRIEGAQPFEEFKKVIDPLVAAAPKKPAGGGAKAPVKKTDDKKTDDKKPDGKPMPKTDGKTDTKK